jgi:hypothetical protein
MFDSPDYFKEIAWHDDDLPAQAHDPIISFHNDADNEIEGPGQGARALVLLAALFFFPPKAIKVYEQQKCRYGGRYRSHPCTYSINARD